jgi:hypothetical protein
MSASGGGESKGSSRLKTAALSLAVTLGLAVAGAEPAVAQTASSQALFLETVRDPGNVDVAPTARSLALGGVRLGTGHAEDAVSSPATLVLGSGIDIVASGGALFYARDELVDTPDRFPPLHPERARTSSTRSTPVFAAASVHGPVWAVAGFFDRSGVFAHRFDTATSNIYFAALQGTYVSEDGTGRASISEEVTRVGGAGALSLPDHRLALGFAWSAVRMDYRAAAHVHVDTESSLYGGPVSTSSSEVDNSATFRGWAPGVVLSAMARPVPAVTVAARWEHAPTFDGTHAVISEDAYQTSRIEHGIALRLPATFSVGASAELARTTIAGEIARTDFSQSLRPIEQVMGTAPCAIPNVNCPGWGFANYRAADATTWRIGGEQGVPAGRGEVLLRAGVQRQTAYTVARPTSDPDRNGGSLPAPPFLSDFEPPRDPSFRIDGGVGYRRGGYELAFGIGRSDTEIRWLADFRVPR